MSLDFEWRPFETKIGNDIIKTQLKPLTRKGNLILITNANLLSKGQNLEKQTPNEINEFLKSVDDFLDQFEQHFMVCVDTITSQDGAKEFNKKDFYDSPKAMLAVFQIINELSRISNLTEQEAKN